MGVECNDKIALVTGANSGIGRDTAFELARRGYTVVLACRRPNEAAMTAQEIMQCFPGARAEAAPKLDLGDSGAIRAFAAELQAKYSRVDVLVNNAGVNFGPAWTTSDGIVGIVQVNYLGPYLLTRLLEQQLSGGRVVNVSSVMHRTTRFCGCHDFFRDPEQGTYNRTKLANALFTLEMNRRSGGLIECAAVDPGGVATSLFRHSAFGRAPFKQIMELFFSPPEEGCQAVVHAATCTLPPPNGKDARLGLPFYARGLFASAIMTSVQPLHGPALALWPFQQLAFAACALSDQPLRSLSGGRWGTATSIVRPAPAALDTTVSKELWDVSSALCGMRPDMHSS